MSTLTATFMETYFKVVHTGLDGDRDEVHAEVPCDGRVLAEMALRQVLDWQELNDLPLDAHIVTRRGTGPWVSLSSSAEQIGAVR
ncbi:hypothetical protein [Streptosporangium canum]|uniref:hypothetical protein n=1 Tax=Streptosporangium canum TaxID=324952 RepID=UPI0037AD783D